MADNKERLRNLIQQHTDHTIWDETCLAEAIIAAFPCLRTSQAEAQAPADPMDGLAAAAFKVEASRMLQQIESKSVPMLDWNKRVARLAKFVIHSLSTPAQAEAQAPAPVLTEKERVSYMQVKKCPLNKAEEALIDIIDRLTQPTPAS